MIPKIITIKMAVDRLKATTGHDFEGEIKSAVESEPQRIRLASSLNYAAPNWRAEADLSTTIYTDSLNNYFQQNYGFIAFEDLLINPKTQLNHRSELLDIMNQAIAEFWENHDPNELPINEDIAKWILENYSSEPLINETIVKSMCTIMRPAKYKTPPKRKKDASSAD